MGTSVIEVRGPEDQDAIAAAGSRNHRIKDVTMPGNVHSVTAGSDGPVPASFIATCDPSMLWEVLVHGTGNRVGVFSADGRIVYANAMANAEFGPKAGRASIVGLALEEYTSPEYAAEWKGFIRRALQAQRPLVVEGMIHGFRFRATLTPVGGPEDGHVLVVSRNASDLPPNDPGVRPGVEVIQAKVRDMGALEDLTEREMEVLELIGEGLSTAEVARRLDRSVKTVEWHRAALGTKLGITNRVELARIAIGAGLCRVPGGSVRHANGRKLPRTPAAQK
jgi:DNA-binding CsgD family transcriptional regulator